MALRCGGGENWVVSPRYVVQPCPLRTSGLVSLGLRNSVTYVGGGLMILRRGDPTRTREAIVRTDTALGSSLLGSRISRKW